MKSVMENAMKSALSVLLIVVLQMSMSACGGGGDDDGDPEPEEPVRVGTFVGNIQVSDDPTTEVGYIYNAKVTVSVSGKTATVSVVGDHGFSREYTGTYTSNAGAYQVTLAKQTKPSEKIVGESVIISNNNLTIVVQVGSDAVTVRSAPGSVDTFEISGKLQMIGTNFIRE